MSNLVFGILFPLIMSLFILLPIVCFSNLAINKKIFLICFFTNFMTILFLHLNMKDILCMFILFLTSFVYLYFTYRNIITSIIITILINIIISLSDHITEFIFVNIIKLSLLKIEESSILYFIFAFFTLLFSCLLSFISRIIFLNVKRVYLNHNKTRNE